MSLLGAEVAVSEELAVVSDSVEPDWENAGSELLEADCEESPVVEAEELVKPLMGDVVVNVAGLAVLPDVPLNDAELDVEEELELIMPTA